MVNHKIKIKTKIKNKKLKIKEKKHNKMRLKRKHKQEHIHFIGIGGISMSAIAQILKLDGKKVTGSDKSEGEQIEILKNLDIPVEIGNNLENVENADLIIYTSAIPETDIEFKYAKKLDKKMIGRAEFMNELTNGYENTISIAGVHGKTSTTSMISNIFLEADLDPSIQVGANFKNIDSNYRIGQSNYLIIEASEYKDDFLHFNSKYSVVTNIELEHIDYFKDLDRIKKSFYEYMLKTDENGFIFVNGDNENIQDILNNFDGIRGEIITFGKEKISKELDDILNNNQNIFDYTFLNFKNIKIENEFGIEFEVKEKGISLGKFQTKQIGEYSAYNALAAIAVARLNNIEIDKIRLGLYNFKGAGRRFDYKGVLNGAMIYEDYAHHPTEIISLSEGIKELDKNKTYCIFEAHTFSRLNKFLKEFAKSLINFDNIYIAPIYAAREDNLSGVTIFDLKKEILNLDNQKNVKCFESFKEIVEDLKLNIKENDLVICTGAGNITNLPNMILND